MSFSTQNASVDEESILLMHTDEHGEQASLDNPDYILVRVPVVNGVPQCSVLPSDAYTKTATHVPIVIAKEDPAEDVEPIVKPATRRAVYILPIVTLIVLIPMWALSFTITGPGEYSWGNWIVDISIVGSATLNVLIQIPISFIGIFGNKKPLRFGFWIAIPFAAALLPLIITGFVQNLTPISSELSIPGLGIGVLGLQITWIVLSSFVLGRLCSCKTCC